MAALGYGIYNSPLFSPLNRKQAQAERLMGQPEEEIRSLLGPPSEVYVNPRPGRLKFMPEVTGDGRFMVYRHLNFALIVVVRERKVAGVMRVKDLGWRPTS